LAVTDWRLRRLRLWFLALSNALRKYNDDSAPCIAMNKIAIGLFARQMRACSIHSTIFSEKWWLRLFSPFGASYYGIK